MAVLLIPPTIPLKANKVCTCRVCVVGSIWGHYSIMTCSSHLMIFLSKSVQSKARFQIHHKKCCRLIYRTSSLVKVRDFVLMTLVIDTLNLKFEDVRLILAIH